MTVMARQEEGDDERTKAIKVIERMLSRNQADWQKVEEAIFKIAYPLPP
jgi:hypothetical protein